MESVGSNNCGISKDNHCNDLDDIDGQRSDDDDDDDNEHDNLASSGDDTHKGRDEDNESLNRSLSSPGGLSGLSSLQSPSTSLASPLGMLISPAMPQHGNGLLQTPINEQLQQHQQHMQVLQAQQQHLNQKLLQQTKLHHQQQQQQPGQQQQQQQSIASLGLNSNTGSVSTYENSIISAAAGVVSTILPTLSTSSSSSSGSVSGYSSASSCSTNTSSTSSPASLSDRMVRSLLSNSPAMLLSNRIGHIAMGLAMSNNSINNSNSISINDNAYNSLAMVTTTTDGLNHVGGTSTIAQSTCSTTNTRPSTISASAMEKLAATAPATPTPTSNTSLNIIRSEILEKAINVTTVLTSNLSPSISSVASSAASSPTGTGTLSASLNTTISNCNHVVIPLQRNPIGANPRDINNPLSINQLTKRPRDESNEVSNISSNKSINNNINTSTSTINLTGSSHTTTTANVIFNHMQVTHNLTQTALTLPPPHNAMFSNNFTQHFQQQFGHHLATAAAAAAAIASGPIQSVAQSSRGSNGNSICNNNVNNNNSATGNSITTSAMSLNLDVGRCPTSDTTATNESGAISVT